MAVQARHLNLFPSQLISQREKMNQIQPINFENMQYGNSNFPFNNQNGLGVGDASMNQYSLVPISGSIINGGGDPILQQAKTTSLKDNSGITFNNNNLASSRKRARDSSSLLATIPITTNRATAEVVDASTNPFISITGGFSFLGEDISVHVMHQQLELDRIIFQHMENVRIEMAERRRKQQRQIGGIIEEELAKRMKEKDEEIKKICKLNSALEERVKSLCIENQIWRDLAQTHEATANALQTHVQHVTELDNDISRWGSSNDAEVTIEGKHKGIKCNKCGQGESSVLLLPCKHLCVCKRCGPHLNACPLCKSAQNASTHVNLA